MTDLELRVKIVQDYSEVLVAMRGFIENSWQMDPQLKPIAAATVRELADTFESEWNVSFSSAESAVRDRGPVALFDFVKEVGDE